MLLISERAASHGQVTPVTYRPEIRTKFRCCFVRHIVAICYKCLYKLKIYFTQTIFRLNFKYIIHRRLSLNYRS